MEDVPPEAAVQRRLAEINKASGRAADLVRRILAFSRQQEVSRQVRPLQPIVEETLQLLRATLPAMIAIRTRFAAGVPDIIADAAHIQQILMNLGTNAAYAMDERGGLLEVQIDAVTMDAASARLSPDLHVGPYVRLSVSDNGHGMDGATLARLFEPFFTTRPPGQGTGLGLSVVHGIMQRHDGAIIVDSAPGHGTTVHLYFPAAAPAAAPPEPPEDQPGAGAQVLYVDDEAALVALAAQTLERLGYHVTTCTDPMQALQTFRARPYDFDAVLTDLAMPGMSGLELARALLDIRPEVPIILSSGYVRPQDQTAAQRLGIRAMIPKPHTVKELAQALHCLSSTTPAVNGPLRGPGPLRQVDPTLVGTGLAHEGSD
jgi:CheY-like chemotaxis protein